MLALARTVCTFAILYGVHGQTSTTAAPDPTPSPTGDGSCCACTELPEVVPGQRQNQQQDGCPEDLVCQDLLCAEINGQCCGRRWGEQCAAAATAKCAASSPDYTTCCGCLETHNAGECTFDEACTTLVCDHDDFCCSSQWDEVCVIQANAVCLGVEPPPCCGCSVSSTEPGCAVDPECEGMVCGGDAFCCGFDENGDVLDAQNVRWDEQCAQTALDICNGIAQGTTTTSQPLLE